MVLRRQLSSRNNGPEEQNDAKNTAVVFRLEFSAQQALPRSVNLSERWIPATDPAIIAGGVDAYTWVLPLEAASAPMGAFAFRMTNKEKRNSTPKIIIFPVVVAS